MLIIKAGHGHMGICFNIFFTFVIENFHSKKVFLSKMVLFLGFLNNVTKIQIHKVMCLMELEQYIKSEKKKLIY